MAMAEFGGETSDFNGGGLNNTNFMAGSEFGDKKRGDIAREHCIILIFLES